MLQYLVLLGAAINVLGSFAYIRDTLRGIAKPNRVTWLLWSLAPLIATAAALASGVRWAVLPVFMSGFCPFLIFLSSFANKNAYWHLKPFDYLCGALSLLALVLWAITQEPVIAIIFAIISDTMAALPTLIKLWSHPETESAPAYAAGLISALTSFAAIKSWTFPQYGFGVYLVIMCTFLTLFAYRPKIFRQRGAVRAMKEVRTWSDTPHI